jgi:hypothetical protein
VVAQPAAHFEAPVTGEEDSHFLLTGATGYEPNLRASPYQGRKAHRRGWHGRSWAYFRLAFPPAGPTCSLFPAEGSVTSEKNMEAVEAARAKFRPERITTLFVGESAPSSGDFFYYGNSAMTRHMQSAVQHSLGGGGGDFLEGFKAYGWYLDDLVLTPVNNLTKSERRAKCLAAQKSLADRIVKYRPLAIVSLLRSIESIVNAAANAADSDAPRFAVPFPGVGQ